MPKNTPGWKKPLAIGEIKSEKHDAPLTGSQSLWVDIGDRLNDMARDERKTGDIGQFGYA